MSGRGRGSLSVSDKHAADFKTACLQKCSLPSPVRIERSTSESERVSSSESPSPPDSSLESGDATEAIESQVTESSSVLVFVFVLEGVTGAVKGLGLGLEGDLPDRGCFREGDEGLPTFEVPPVCLRFRPRRPELKNISGSR